MRDKRSIEIISDKSKFSFGTLSFGCMFVQWDLHMLKSQTISDRLQRNNFPFPHRKKMFYKMFCFDSRTSSTIGFNGLSFMFKNWKEKNENPSRVFFRGQDCFLFSLIKCSIAEISHLFDIFRVKKRIDYLFETHPKGSISVRVRDAVVSLSRNARCITHHGDHNTKRKLSKTNDEQFTFKLEWKAHNFKNLSSAQNLLIN